VKSKKEGPWEGRRVGEGKRERKKRKRHRGSEALFVLSWHSEQEPIYYLIN
jgi:hypothetical protein